MTACDLAAANPESATGLRTPIVNATALPLAVATFADRLFAANGNPIRAGPMTFVHVLKIGIVLAITDIGVGAEFLNLYGIFALSTDDFFEMDEPLHVSVARTHAVTKRVKDLENIAGVLFQAIVAIFRREMFFFCWIRSSHQKNFWSVDLPLPFCQVPRRFLLRNCRF